MAVGAWLKRARTSLIHRTRRGLVVEELRAIRKELESLRFGLSSDALKTCPICLAGFPEFNAFRGRANARCPSCGSFERHRLSWLFLKSETTLFREPTRFLHFAPEDMMRQRIAHNLNVAYTAASYDPAKPEHGIDIQQLPFADGSFDLTYCSHVLEHIPDDRRAMRELARVLRVGGLAVIMVPTRNTAKTYEDPAITSPEERAKHFGRWDHLRWYGRDIVTRLQEAGFDVKIVYHHDALTFDEQRRYGVAPEPILLCRRV